MRRTTLALAAIACGSLGTAAQASVLYATNYAGSTPLYTLDQSTGAASSVGGALTNIGDLTSWGSTLYGVTLLGNSLVTIDPATGAQLTSVAITGTRAGEITSIAADPLTGTLYGNTTPGFGDTGGVGDRLYTIDPLTGAATLVGASGAIGFSNTYALGFTQSGLLYGISDDSDELIVIDLVTGAGTAIGAVSLSLSFDIASRPEDDIMFALDSSSGSLWTLDLATAAATLVGAWSGPTNLAGLAFLADEVPEPAMLGLFGFGLGLLALRRRRRPV